MEIWNLGMPYYIRIEFAFISKHRDVFFNVVSDRDLVHRSFVTGRDWGHPSCLENAGEYTRNVSSLRELVDCTTETPNQDL